MRFAAQEGFIVLSQDLDFSAILAATQGRKPSVVQLRSDEVRSLAIGHRVVAALKELAPELEAGALLAIGLDRTRMRLLPLRG